MEIAQRQLTEGIEFIVSGRLDAHWAEDLDRELAGAVRAGARRIHLDMASVDYISSMGIRILLKYWKQLRAVNGVFRVVSPSENVRNIVAMSGMADLFEAKGDPGKLPPSAAGAPPEVRQAGGGRFIIYQPHPDSRLTLQLIGRPESLMREEITAADVAAISLTAETTALGLGAFGADWQAVRTRGGEFLAAGGAAICLPTDGAGRPDDQVAVGEFIPRIQALYALRCAGRFRHFFSFEPDHQAEGAPLPLSLLVETAYSLAAAPAAGLVFIAESDGLVGAMLRKPPAEQGGRLPFSFPEVRDWFSLTTERAHPRTLALVVGIIAGGGNPALSPFLRPLGGSGSLSGHIHAAALSYRALPAGLLDLPKTLPGLLETQRLQGLLHLLNDHRPIAGIGESLFIRGAAWTGPLDCPPPRTSETPDRPPASGANREDACATSRINQPPEVETSPHGTGPLPPPTLTGGGKP